LQSVGVLQQWSYAWILRDVVVNCVKSIVGTLLDGVLSSVSEDS